MKKYWHQFVVHPVVGVRCTRCEQRASKATQSCPGKPLDFIDSLAVKEGLLDFRDGKWVREPTIIYQCEHGRNTGPELHCEEPKSFWGYLPSVSVILLVIISLASIYELYTKAY